MNAGNEMLFAQNNLIIIKNVELEQDILCALKFYVIFLLNENGHRPYFHGFYISI